MTLSEDEFSYDGHDYAISGIRETASSLQIAFTRTIATGASQSLVFMVDGDAFPFGDGTITPSARTWSSAAAAAISWSARQDVAVSLVEPAPVWSGTLTVKASGVVLGCSNGFTNNHCRDQLSDDDFTHDSTDYAITSLFLRRNGELQFVVDTNFTTATQALTLNVGGTAFAFEDADTKTILTRTWNNSGLSWTAGDTVSLTLTEGTTTTPDPPPPPGPPTGDDCGRSHWDRDKRLATQLLDASCEYVARNRNNLADGQVSAEELAEIRPLMRRLREIVDDLPCGFGYRYYDDAGEQTLYKGAPPECLVRTTKSGGGGLPWEEISPNPNQPPGPGGGGGGGGGPRQTVPGAPRNLLVEGGDGQVTLTWDAPEDDGDAEITDYEYRIDRSNPWISIGSTDTTHTVTGLVNGTAYVFEVRAVNAAGRSASTNRAEAKPEVFTLDFAHFANGAGITSDLVFVNVGTRPIRPALYFYDQEGQPMAAESMVEVTGDLEIREDGSLSIQTAMEPLGELTISTHGQGELVSGSVKVVAFGSIGGVLRFDLPGIGVAGVGASPPVRDAVFPVRRQEAGINTGVAIHNLESSAELVRCELMREGVLHDAVSLPLAANGQSSWFIDAAFPAADTSDFAGSVHCDAAGPGMFTAVALELDAASRIFTTLPVLSTRRAGGRAAELNFAHFANGDGLTSDLVFLNLSTERSRPAPTPFHTDILPVRPALYFYGTEGQPMAAESVVDITGDLEIREDGGLTVRTEMEPLGVLTISTHGRGELVSGSVRVAADEPIGGALRFDLPGIGVAGVGASPPLRDALFPVRRQEAGINTGVAVHNLGEEAMEVTCELMQGGTVLDDVSIPLAANGQASWFIDEVFTGADTSDFAGSVRCTAPGEGMFTGVAVELDAARRIFTTLPVVPVPERTSQE